MKKELLLYSIMGLNTAHIDEIVEDIRLQKERGVSDCALFSMSLVPEGDPPVDKIGPLLEKYRLFKARLDALGLKSGVLVQSSLGHGYKLAHPSGFTKYRGIKELSDSPNVLCPFDDGVCNYLYEISRAIAQEHPDMIMLDDDFRMIYYRMSGANRGNGCCCALHMKEFNELSGESFTDKELAEILFSGKGDYRRYTDIFIDTQRRSLVKAARAMRAGIDSVDPTIPGSYCCCGPNGDFAVEIANELKGEGNPSVVRWNNGVYLASTGRERITWAFQYAREQYEKLHGGVDFLLAETDTCPQNRYSTSAAVLNVHFTGSILEGAQGAKQWITKLNAHEPRSGRAYRKILSKNRPFYDALAGIVPELKWHGARIPVPSKPYYDFSNLTANDATNCWGTKVLERLGLPMYYSSEAGGVAFLDGAQDRRFDEGKMTEMLSGTLVLSSSAAKSIIERGLGEYIGTEVLEWCGVTPKGEDLPSGAHLGNQPSVKELRPFADAQVLGYVTTTDDTVTHTPLFPAITKYKNSLGGTVYVYSGTPNAEFHFGPPFSYLCESRKRQLADILAEAGELPVYTTEDTDIYLKSADMKDGSTFVALFNLGLDPIESVPLRTAKPCTAAQRLGSDGEWHDVALSECDGEVILDAYINAFEPSIFKLI